MVNTATIKLNADISIPQLGLGTWQSANNDAYHAVIAALKAGYRHIDTAAIYKNEVQVGKAIKDSGVPRSELFVTTKLWGSQHREPAVALADSLERLGLDYVDLYLIHWPVPLQAGDETLVVKMNPDGSRALDLEWDFVKTWELMQELPKTGKTRAVGVSNFSVNNLKTLLSAETTKVVPAANQCECHPLLPQDELIDFCKSKGIVFEAYSPLGSTSSPLFTNATLKTIADSYGVSIPQVLINWAFKRGYVVLPKSVTESRIIENAKIVDLSSDDFSTINEIVHKEGQQRLIVPDWSPFPTFE
uniref:Aldo-keto reductase n=1 Tax=Cyberlindnera americana TaxID=36016 RepID=A0A5P8N8R6_9ASCO|nr:aldo-keto reductase [Cyberlindnera americana]